MFSRTMSCSITIKLLYVFFLLFHSYAGGYTACEFGDFTVVHALTGWLPEVIPLR